MGLDVLRLVHFTAWVAELTQGEMLRVLAPDHTALIDAGKVQNLLLAGEELLYGEA